MGTAQGQRQPGMPQLPFDSGDGPVEADRARRCDPHAFPAPRQGDLHRLPQGDRPPVAGHDRRARLGRLDGSVRGGFSPLGQRAVRSVRVSIWCCPPCAEGWRGPALVAGPAISLPAWPERATIERVGRQSSCSVGEIAWMLIAPGTVNGEDKAFVISNPAPIRIANKAARSSARRPATRAAGLDQASNSHRSRSHQAPAPSC